MVLFLLREQSQALPQAHALVQPAGHGASVVGFEALSKPAIAKAHATTNALTSDAVEAAHVGSLSSAQDINHAIAAKALPKAWDAEHDTENKVQEVTSFEAAVALAVPRGFHAGQVTTRLIAPACTCTAHDRPAARIRLLLTDAFIHSLQDAWVPGVRRSVSLAAPPSCGRFPLRMS